MLSLSLATRLALTYNLPMLCIITSQLLAGIGIAAGAYLILRPTRHAKRGDLAVVQAEGRTLIGLYFPGDNDALIYLPERSVLVKDHTVIAELVPADPM